MNNEPVAWMVNDKPYKDIFEAEHYSTFTNKPMIPLYTHPAKTEDEQFKKGFEAGKQEGWKAHKFHHPADLTDEVLMQLYEVADYSPESYLEEARAILRKVQEK